MTKFQKYYVSFRHFLKISFFEVLLVFNFKLEIILFSKKEYRMEMLLSTYIPAFSDPFHCYEPN